MAQFFLTTTWQQVSSGGSQLQITKNGDLRRVVFAEAATQPTPDVVGIDLADGRSAITMLPNSPLWLRIGDAFGPLAVEVDQVG